MKVLCTFINKRGEKEFKVIESRSSSTLKEDLVSSLIESVNTRRKNMFYSPLDETEKQVLTTIKIVEYLPENGKAIY